MFKPLYRFKDTNSGALGTGTKEFAFEPNFLLPLVSILGAGYSPFQQFRTLQPQQGWYNRQDIQFGWQGVVAGTLWRQPLTDAGQQGNI